MKIIFGELGLAEACTLIMLAFTASVVSARSITVVDGRTLLHLTELPVQRRCVVVASSGSYEADKHACNRALATNPSTAVGMPVGTYLFPGRDRRYANGTCAYPEGTRPTSAEEAVCAQLLKSMGKARVTMAIGPERWVRPTEFQGQSASPSGILISIGVSASGRASYCTVIRSSKNAPLDAFFCEEILNRARFAPAMDEEGRPIPSAYDRQWTF